MKYVVYVAFLLLFVGIASATVLPERCIIDHGFTCDEYGNELAGARTDVWMHIVNGGEDDVEIRSFEGTVVLSNGSSKRIPCAAVDIVDGVGVGETFTVNCWAIHHPEARLRVDFSMRFIDETGLEHTATGQVSTYPWEKERFDPEPFIWPLVLLLVLLALIGAGLYHALKH